MSLFKLISERKREVVEQWYEMVLATYPPETAKIWKRNKDQFTNPVGNTYLSSLDTLVGLLLEWNDAQAVCASVEDVVKIRAVQDFAPSKALSVFFLFKKVLRELFRKELKKDDGHKLYRDLEVLDGRIDNLVLMSFDIYSKSREALYEMKVQDYKRKHHMLFRKAGMMCDASGEVQGLLGGGGPESA